MHSWSTGESATWSLLIHGGAGDVPDELIPAHIEGGKKAAAAGAEVLAKGGSALDAVEAAVRALEADPHFNAGTGACLNEDGHIELDASIMSGADLRAGAVCAMPPFEHPIAIARRAMEDGRHVLYAGEGAVRFARAQGFVPGDEAKMITARARERWVAVRAKGEKEVKGWAGGTVGAVARDAAGHVASATSTGGRINKGLGRVGDSPIIGAGTYADDEAGAASTTGDGEAMMRLLTARTSVDALRASLDETGALRGGGVELAAIAGIAQIERRLNATGGVIIVGRDGALAWARNTKTMTWAAASNIWNGVQGGA
jgi:beta-aspartyl-peptidase (threonine type)